MHTTDGEHTVSNTTNIGRSLSQKKPYKNWAFLQQIFCDVYEAAE